MTLSFLQGPEGSTLIGGADTWINLGLLILLMGGAISLTSTLTTLKLSVAKAVENLTSIDKRLQRLEVSTVDDPWTGTHMQLFCAELKKANPTMEVPDPRFIGPLRRQQETL